MDARTEAGTDAASSPRTKPLIQPLCLSHGTITCRSLAASRPFYEDFLGFDCVRHTERGILLRRGGYLAIVCLEVGEHVKPVDRQHHWGLDLESREAVDRALELAHQYKDRYGIQRISRITGHHGTYAFYFMDLDGNHWEFQYTGGGLEPGTRHYDTFFARGDVVPM